MGRLDYTSPHSWENNGKIKQDFLINNKLQHYG